MARVASRSLRRSARLALSVAVLIGIWQRPALADVSEVTGAAYGFSSTISLFDGPAVVSGPLPVVSLPPAGSAEVITQSDPHGALAKQGPAIVVRATALTVSTEGTTGPDGSVTSSASVVFDGSSDDRIDPFSADGLASRCTARESEVTGSTTLDNAFLVTSTDFDGEPVEIINLPTNPAPNTTMAGTNDAVGDTFRIVLNEQIREGDTLTVNAVHVYLGQNAEGESVEGVARGEAIVGHSVCGISSSGPTGSDDAVTDTVLETGLPTTQDRRSTPTTMPGEAVALSEQVDPGGSLASPLIGVLVGGLAAGFFLWLRHLRRRPRR